MQIAFLTIAVIILAISVILLSLELNDIKRAQRASISLQLYQQFDEPSLQSAITQVRQIGNQPNSHSNGHSTNGYSANGHTGQVAALNGHEKAQKQAVDDVDHFFSHVGELVQRGIADEDVFTLMGPTIRDMWHCMRPVRQHVAAENGSANQDGFDYLYTGWLNWDYQHRAQPTDKPLASPTANEATPVHEYSH